MISGKIRQLCRRFVRWVQAKLEPDTATADDIGKVKTPMMTQKDTLTTNWMEYFGQETVVQVR
jgi:hypothetical protein